MLEASENGSFYAQGLSFSCKRCSACCRFEEGYVFLSRKDVTELCRALNMKYDDFLETHCRWVPSDFGKCQLSLKEKKNYDCVFWSSSHGGGCLVYETRPLQCRTFPFWASVMNSKKSWKITASDCPGMDIGTFHSQDSIKKMLAMRQMEPIIFKNV